MDGFLFLGLLVTSWIIVGLMTHPWHSSHNSKGMTDAEIEKWSKELIDIQQKNIDDWEELKKK